MEMVRPAQSRVFGTFFIDGTHVVAGFGAHEAPATGASIALSVAMDRASFFVLTAVGRSAQRRSAGKKRKSNGIIPPDD